MKKSEVLEAIYTHYKFKNKSVFARFLEKTPQVLSNWFSRETYDAELLAEKFPELNPVWILTAGETGEMFKEKEYQSSLDENFIEEPEKEYKNILKELIEKSEYNSKEVAQKIGVTEKTVYNWQSNISALKYNEIKKLADLFQITPLDLYHNYKEAKALNLTEVKEELKTNNKTTKEILNKLEKTTTVMQQFSKIISNFDVKSEELKEQVEAISSVISLAVLDIDSLKEIQSEQLNLYRKINKI